MSVKVAIYSKQGKKGDKIWCCFDYNGEAYTAHGPTGIRNVNLSTPHTLAFRNVTLIKSNSTSDILNAKLRSGYKYVGEYSLDITTKTAGLNSSFDGRAAPAQPPKAKSTPARQRVKAGRLSTAVVWAW